MGNNGSIIALDPSHNGDNEKIGGSEASQI